METSAEYISEVVINAFGNQGFSSAAVFDALKDAPSNSSTAALLSVLTQLEEYGKEHYNDDPTEKQTMSSLLS